MFQEILFFGRHAGNASPAAFLAAVGVHRLPLDITLMRQRNDNVSALQVTVDELVFDADEASQTRVARAVAALSKASDVIDWKLADNTIVSVTKAQLQKVLQAAVKQQTEIWTE